MDKCEPHRKPLLRHWLYFCVRVFRSLPRNGSTCHSITVEADSPSPVLNLFSFAEPVFLKARHWTLTSDTWIRSFIFHQTYLICEVFTPMTMKIAIFWYVTQFTLVDFHRCFGRACCFYLQVSQEEVCHSSEITVKIYQITERHIPEDSNPPPNTF
jgi:hypothetical protein